MNLNRIYSSIKKEHVFIFLVILTSLILFNYFNFGYTGLTVKDTCYDQGYSCCSSGTGQGNYYFSLDNSCSANQECWNYCKNDISERKTNNIITTKAGFIDSVNNFFTEIKSSIKKFFGKEAVGGIKTISPFYLTGAGTEFGWGSPIFAYDKNNDNLYLFTLSNDFKIIYKKFDDDRWSDWNEIPGQESRKFIFSPSVSICSYKEGCLNLISIFMREFYGNGIYHAYAEDANLQWSNLVELGLAGSYAPASGFRKEDSLEVYSVGHVSDPAESKKFYERYSNADNNWPNQFHLYSHGLQITPIGVNFNSDLHEVVESKDLIHFFVIGTDNKLWYTNWSSKVQLWNYPNSQGGSNWFYNTVWATWFSLDDDVKLNPVFGVSGVSVREGAIDVFAVDESGEVLRKSYRSFKLGETKWSVWEKLSRIQDNKKAISKPSAIIDKDGRLRVYALLEDKEIYYKIIELNVDGSINDKTEWIKLDLDSKPQQTCIPNTCNPDNQKSICKSDGTAYESCGSGKVCQDNQCVVQGPVCGNNIIEGSEQCDGTTVTDCYDLGYESGQSSCKDDCSIDASQCSPQSQDNPPTISVSHQLIETIEGSQTFAINAQATDEEVFPELQIKIYGDDSTSPLVTCNGSPTCGTTSTIFGGTHSYFATAKDASGQESRDPVTGVKSYTYQPSSICAPNQCNSADNTQICKSDGTAYESCGSGKVCQDNQCITKVSPITISGPDQILKKETAAYTISGSQIYKWEISEGISNCILTVRDPFSATIYGDKAGDCTLKVSSGNLFATKSIKVLAICGDGVIEGDEECDGNNLNGQTCKTKGYLDGQLSCNPSNTANKCKFNADQCISGFNLPKPFSLKASTTNNDIILTWYSSYGSNKNDDNKKDKKDALTGSAVLENENFLQKITDFFKSIFKRSSVGTKVSSEVNGYKVTRTITLGPDKLNSKTFEIKLNQCQGNLCTFTDSETLLKNNKAVKYEIYSYNQYGESQKVEVDISSPKIKSFTFSQGSTTKVKDVSLALNADYAYECRYASSQNDLSSSTYEIYSQSKSWSLTEGEGQKQAYVQCRNLFGESSSSASISLQTKSENDIDCNNGADDDGDGIRDSLDRDCPAKGQKVLIESINVLDTKPFEDADFETQCKISVSGGAELYEAEPCVIVNLSNKKGSSNLCEFQKRSSDLLRFKCDAGSFKEDKIVSCQVNAEKCYGDSNAANSGKKLEKKNIAQKFVNVTVPDFCEKETGTGRLSVSIDLNDKEYRYQDKIKPEFEIENLDNEDLEIVTEMYLYDVNEKEELAKSSKIQVIDEGLDAESIDIELTAPKLTESKYKLYFKIYLKDDENEICFVKSNKIELKAYEVTSSNTTDLGTLSANENRKSLSESDILTFKLNDGTSHTIELLDVSSNIVKIKVSSSPKEFNLNIGESKEVDVDDDLVNDLYVKLNSIINNKADISFKAVSTGSLCTDGETRECGNSIGICKKGTQTCSNGAWSSCSGAILSSQEVCDDSLDNDCNGLTDCNDANACSSFSVCKEVTKNNPDSDNDGLPDEWELDYFSNLNQKAEDDFDGDGFTNSKEYSSSTDPADSSSKPEKSSGFKIILIVISILIIAGAAIWLFAFKPRRNAPQFPPAYSPVYKPNKESSGANLTLVNYIKNSLQKGYSNQQVRTALKVKGWKDREIDDAFRAIK